MSERLRSLRARAHAALADELTSVLRHDVRNKLASVRNAAFYLRRRAETAGLAEREPKVPTFFDLIDSELSAADGALAFSPSLARRAPTPLGDRFLDDAIRDAFAIARLPSPQLVDVPQRRPLRSADDVALVVALVLESLCADEPSWPPRVRVALTVDAVGATARLALEGAARRELEAEADATRSRTSVARRAAMRIARPLGIDVTSEGTTGRSLLVRVPDAMPALQTPR